jgi:hypothetical protein
MKFQTIRIEGNTISSDILDKISEGNYKGQLPKDFGFEANVKVKDEIARAWADAQSLWKIFKSRTSNLDDTDTGTPEVRKYWMIPFLGLLDYNLETGKSEKLENGNDYSISHREIHLDNFPLHIVGFKDTAQKAPEERSTLDIKPSNASRRMSPHALVQEYVNLTEHAYGIITNGYQIRLLRDSSRLVKLSFLEFDLEQMMVEEAFADFALLFRVLHASRLPKRKDVTAESLIEQYHLDSIESGARIREGLSEAVEKAIRTFANGFLKHPENTELREAIVNGKLSAEKYYQYQLRLIYRLLFLMVTEERNLIYPDKHDKKLRDIYYQYYSVERLRKMVDKRHIATTNFKDQWEGLKRAFQLFESEKYGKPLGIKPLNGDLFGLNTLGQLFDCVLDNQTMMDCMRTLTVFVNKNSQQLVRINYASLNVEEFGSVYEGLLEYDPVFHIEENSVRFDFKEGQDRSSSGSHYTPEELVQPLIKYSLEYTIQEKLKQKNPKLALLSIKVCDIACGSGHILLSAARRIATEVARIRTGEEQPTPSALRGAVRDVIKNCIYGVDKNPLAVELCKVALWLESHNPGEPLGFLDHHIKCGDAIVGLGHRTELDEGIPDEAFKTLPADDKIIAKTYRDQNIKERKARSAKAIQLTADFEKTSTSSVQEAMVEYKTFNQLPETTPVEIERKVIAYKKFIDGKGISFLRSMADTQVAQFFISKNESNKDNLITDTEFRLMLTGYKGWTGPKTGKATAIAQKERFFHWFIEFPDVFNEGGFDCILGNPPFLGGQKLSGFFGNSFLEYIKYAHRPIGAVDLVTYFFRRIFNILKPGGFQSLISTNTIAQGSAREDGLDVICSRGGTINHAVRSMRWPGQAAVEVALVTIHKGKWTMGFVLDNKKVERITPYLDDSEVIGNPFPLKQNEGKSFQGSIVLGKGFVLTPQEAESLIAKDSRNKDVLFPYLNGEDLNNDPEQKASRWVINFFDWSEEKARSYPDCFEIIERLVKPERQRWKIDANGQEVEGTYALRKPLPQKWWIYGEKRPALYETISKLDQVMAISEVTKYVAFTLVPIDLIFMHTLKIIAKSDWVEFCLMNSSIYAEWCWKYSSTMGSGTLRYTPSTTYDPFPFLTLHKAETIDTLNQLGPDFHKVRHGLMVEARLGITKLYNQVHNRNLSEISIEDEQLNDQLFEKKFGKESAWLRKHLQTVERIQFNSVVSRIKAVRVLQTKIDATISNAFGWNDISLNHNFHEIEYLPENDRVRFSIHPISRKEILKRLLLLNYEKHKAQPQNALKVSVKNRLPKNAETNLFQDLEDH